MKPAQILRRVKRSVPRKPKFNSINNEVQKNGTNASPNQGNQKNAGKLYYDPANNTLDFTKTNRTLLREIRNLSINRNRMRIEDPALFWARLHGNKGQVEAIKKEAETAFLGARISPISSFKPLSVGDMVILNENSTLLNLVVAAPNTLASNVYTFVNHEGEVTFGTKHHIRLRIPGVLSRAQTEAMNLVAIERKLPGLAPIGVPDSAFSRRKEGSLKENNKKTPESLLLPLEPASASLDAGPRDFTVAQASSQLLTDTNVNTYIVPTSAREVYSNSLARISIEAFLKITDFGNRLDYFHKVLQYDDSDCLIQSVRTVPIFDLFLIVSTHNVPSGAPECGEDLELEYKKARAQIRRFTNNRSQALGMALPDHTARNYAVTSYSASEYIAFISALIRSGRKWNINVQKSTQTPVSVDVLPMHRADSLASTLEYLKNGGIEEISAYVVSIIQNNSLKPTQAPSQFASTRQMLKDFVASNITDDSTMDSLLASLVRSIDTKLQALGTFTQSLTQFSHEFARLRAYEILMALEKTGDRNPLQWDSALGLPETQTSHDADKYLKFYQYLDSQFTSKKNLLTDLQTGFNGTNSELAPPLVKYLSEDFYCEDPMAEVREDFGNTPVYCIDSETAHEIDDGISIEDLGKELAVTVHIANPTSYLKPDSSLSQIALNKGTTVYLPEGPTMMLPGIVSQLCGLNGGKITRTLGIRFLLEKENLQAYHDIRKPDPTAKPLDALAQSLRESIEKTTTIKFYNVSNFPKNFTYKKVNEVLNDPANIDKFRNNQLNKDSHEQNLFNLHSIADIIKHFRVGLGSGFEMNSDSSKVSVDYSKEDIPKDKSFVKVENGWQIAFPKGNKEDTPVISITREINQNNQSKSQHLVSNLMIAANYAGSVFAKREGFSIIYRHLELDVKGSVWKEIQLLNRSSYFKNKNFNPDERSQLLSVVTSANFLTFQLGHDLLGLSLYLNFTSPLRRYVDMVNHWKFQEYILMQHRKSIGIDQPESKEVQLSRDRSKARPDTGTSTPLKKSKLQKKPNPLELKLKPPLRKEFGMRTSDMDYIASHLQGCELRNRKAQKFSDKFWMAKFLRRYFEMKQAGEIETPIELLFLLGSDAKHGDIRAELVGFSSLKTTIIQTQYVVLKFSNEEWSVGQVLKSPRFRVLKLDFIEGEFTVELVSPDDVSEDII